jgi:hypothetical protein
MAMTKQLWSISALATELGRDRRTVAKALSTVACDGKIGGQKAWFLNTALLALDRLDRTPPEPEDQFTSMLLDRVDRSLRLSSVYDGPTFSVEDVSEMFEVAPADVLNWLRAGMPYVQKGDWTTGEGFRFFVAWVMDWVVFVTAYASHRGRPDLLKKLGLSL